MSGLTVAVLGLGEAGSRLASDLTAAGAEVRGYDPLGGGTPADAVAGSDVVLSVNSARDAVEAADGARGTLGQKALYADLNTTAPALKREVAELVGEPRFADVALLGPVPVRGLNTPALASGGAAEAFAKAFGPLGMPVDVVSARAGDAATLKLLRSVFMKGLAASAIESVRAASISSTRLTACAWLPTVDSPAETAGRTEPKPGDKVPLWAKLQHELRGLGFSVEPVLVRADDGSLLPETRAVLRAIARHGLILATGHLGREDIFAVVDGALEEGVETIVVTHPEFPAQDFSIEEQVALAGKGCLLERCLSTPHSGKTTFEHVFEGVRATEGHNYFSSDFGNPDYPEVEDGLALWADHLLGAGFDEDEIHEMVVGQSRRLAGDS